jgi:hypothetical protein
MKDWQHGYELEYLKELESKYADYNAYTLSPFAQFKKNNIAEALHKETLTLLDDAALEVVESKSASNITMHGDAVIARKEKGDMTVGKLSGNLSTLKECLKPMTKFNRLAPNRDVWLYVWAENDDHCKLAEECGFCYVGPKITTYGEIFAIYYRGAPRQFPKVDPAEYLSIKQIGTVSMNLIKSIREKLEILPEFTNHYSNYNKDKSWSALSLRGYTEDPSFITKPIEMSKTWQEENKDVKFEMQDTPLFNLFPEIKQYCNTLGNQIHRVRFMRLKPGGGELERHTDQVDPDSGGALNKLARIHLPIKTNPDMIFTVWNTKGEPQKVHMTEGDVWFLDTRKAHQAINNGNEERIHLVIDVRVEENLHESLVS